MSYQGMPRFAYHQSYAARHESIKSQGLLQKHSKHGGIWTYGHDDPAGWQEHDGSPRFNTDDLKMYRVDLHHQSVAPHVSKGAHGPWIKSDVPPEALSHWHGKRREWVPVHEPVNESIVFTLDRLIQEGIKGCSRCRVPLPRNAVCINCENQRKKIEKNLDLASGPLKKHWMQELERFEDGFNRRARK